MQLRQALFRADASPAIGTGHVIRCRTLARALVPHGWAPKLATHDLPDALVEGWPGGEAAIIRLADGDPGEPEPELISVASDADGRVELVVVDHYDLGAAWFEALRRVRPGASFMAIDDLADRPLPVDLVLNQNLGVTPDAYAQLVPDGTRILTGPRHALLRPEFATLRDRGRDRDGRIERILIFMSGADPDDVTRRATVAIAAVDRPFDVVVGAAYAHLAGLRELLSGIGQATLHVNTDAMAELMDAADLAIGAPSSASWERCALGLPTVLITLADNQMMAGEELDRLGAGLALGWHATVTAPDIEAVVRDLLEDPTRVAAMADEAAAITDGRGTERVLREIEAVRSGRMSA